MRGPARPAIDGGAGRARAPAGPSRAPSAMPPDHAPPIAAPPAEAPGRCRGPPEGAEATKAADSTCGGSICGSRARREAMDGCHPLCRRRFVPLDPRSSAVMCPPRRRGLPMPRAGMETRGPVPDHSGRASTGAVTGWMPHGLWTDTGPFRGAPQPNTARRRPAHRRRPWSRQEPRQADRPSQGRGTSSARSISQAGLGA